MKPARLISSQPYTGRIDGILGRAVELLAVVPSLVRGRSGFVGKLILLSVPGIGGLADIP
jgi:hypothetical protein